LPLFRTTDSFLKDKHERWLGQKLGNSEVGQTKFPQRHLSNGRTSKPVGRPIPQPGLPPPFLTACCSLQSSVITTCHSTSLAGPQLPPLRFTHLLSHHQTQSSHRKAQSGPTAAAGSTWEAGGAQGRSEGATGCRGLTAVKWAHFHTSPAKYRRLTAEEMAQRGKRPLLLDTVQGWAGPQAE
jgi:hypothetical protein